ncbi:MAG: winged helix-turn-helix transcriptional regulator [Clostridiales bacterium]|jgi:DNA-binding MarR family transcriptional regulator|nr:winged helix-turn-helix transcriptional regulator [Clostridiales bacterium]
MKASLRDIIFKISQLNAVHRYYICKTVPQGVYFGQPPILEYLNSHESCTQRELADYLMVSPPSVTMSIKRMQKAGLVEKSTDERDMRYSRIRITEKGLNISRKCCDSFERIDRQMLNGFSEQEIEQLYCFLTRMADNLKADKLSSKDVLDFNEKH